MQKEQLIREIADYIKSVGGFPREWYVGIAASARDRLFGDHKVDEKNGNWIFRTADSSDEARESERYFLDVVYTDGGQGGGDWSSKQVYAYKKTWQTEP